MHYYYYNMPITCAVLVVNAHEAHACDIVGMYVYLYIYVQLLLEGCPVLC